MNTDTAPIPKAPTFYIHEGDERLNTLSERIQSSCIDASEQMGIPLATILGVLEYVKIRLYERAREQND